jgi:hypothetical protein
MDVRRYKVGKGERDLMPEAKYYLQYSVGTIPDALKVTYSTGDSGGDCGVLYDTGFATEYAHQLDTKVVGCPGDRAVASGNPLGSAPCCSGTVSSGGCKGIPGCTDSPVTNQPGVASSKPPVAFQVPLKATEVFVTVQGPCDGTGWIFIITPT